jgi:four helix bundle protein
VVGEGSSVRGGVFSRRLRWVGAKDRRAQPAGGSLCPTLDPTNDRLPFQRLDAYVVAKELAQRVHAARISDRELREQATSAAKSTFLRLSEGLPHEGTAMRRKYFAEANGSLHETLAAMDLAYAVGAARAVDAAAVQALGVRLKRMLRALMH